MDGHEKSSLRHRWNRRKSCSQKNCDGSQWPSRRMVRVREGMSLLLEIWCPVVPFGDNVRYTPISSEEDGRWQNTSSVWKNAEWNSTFHKISWILSCVLGEVGRVTCLWRVAKEKVVSHEKTSSFPCADGSLKLFDLPQPPRGEMAAQGTPVQDENQEQETIFEAENCEDL